MKISITESQTLPILLQFQHCRLILLHDGGRAGRARRGGRSHRRRLLLSGRGSKAWRPPNAGRACTSPHQGQRSHLDALGGLPQRAASPNAGGTPPPARGRTSAGGGRAGAPASHARGDGPGGALGGLQRGRSQRTSAAALRLTPAAAVVGAYSAARGSKQRSLGDSLSQNGMMGV